MTLRNHSLGEINSLAQNEFIRLIGPIFEHSPWIAEAAASFRPFKNFEEMQQRMCKIVSQSGELKQIALVQAHPDLVGRAALTGTLTAESSREQTSAGLGKLSAEEIKLFQKQNASYRENFGFPFVICARMNKKEAILRGFEARLKNSREHEIKIALEEIYKIAFLRLNDII